VFDVQDRVSEAIAEALKIELMPDAFVNLEKDRPKNFEAYEYYLRGMNYISSRWLATEDEQDFETAVGMFNKALEIDPQYSLAYSGMAYGYMLLGAGFSLPAAWKEMERYNDKAFELDPDSAMANIMKAATLHVSGKHEQALSFCRRALDLNPNLAEVNFTAGVVCRQLGLLNKAVKYAEKSIALDPYNPLAFGVAARSYSHMNDPEKALLLWEKAYPLMPAFVFMYLSREHMIMGNFDKAEKIITEAEESGIENIRIRITKAFLFAFKGEKEKALDLRKEAEIFALLGMKIEALDIIEKSIDHPISFNYMSLKNYSLFDNLRDEPRFQKILEIQKQKYEERLIWAQGL
jgi:adenylate cyclase